MLCNSTINHRNLTDIFRFLFKKYPACRPAACKKYVRLKFFCIETAVKLITTYLLSKLELLLNERCKTSKPKNAFKTLMNFASSLIKVEKYFCMKVSIRILEYMQKVQAVSTRECIKLMSKTAEGLQSLKTQSWTTLARQGEPFEIFHPFCRKSFG